MHYVYGDKYIVCTDCFEECKNYVIVKDYLNKEWSHPESRIAKAAFVKKMNSKLKLERMVKCSWCVRNYHLVCILLDPLEKPEQSFICENCLSGSDSGLGRSSWVLRLFQYEAIHLPICDSSTWIQSNVNSFLKENGTDKKLIISIR
jgi:hypothetical protein